MFTKASSGSGKRSVRSALMKTMQPSLGSRKPTHVQKGGPTQSKYKLRESVQDIQQEELRRLSMMSRMGHDSATTSAGGSGAIFPSSWSVEEAQNFHKHVSFVDYDMVNQKTRKSIVQSRFNVLVHDAIINYAPVGISSLMPNQLYSFLKAECNNPAVLSYAASMVVEHSSNVSHATRILNARHQFNFTKQYEEASLTSSDILYFQYISGKRLSFGKDGDNKRSGGRGGDQDQDDDEEHWNATQAAFQGAGSNGGSHAPIDLSFAAQVLPKRPKDFNVDTHFSGVPFHVLLANCPYLKAFGGRLNYMRLIKPLGRHYKPDNNKFGTSAATKDINNSSSSAAKTVPLSSDNPSPRDVEHRRKDVLTNNRGGGVEPKGAVEQEHDGEDEEEMDDSEVIHQNGVEGARTLLDALKQNSTLNSALGYDEINDESDLTMQRNVSSCTQHPYSLDLSGPLSVERDSTATTPGPLTKFKKSNRGASLTYSQKMGNVRLQSRGGVLGALTASEDAALMSFYGRQLGGTAEAVAEGDDADDDDDPFAGMTDEEILGIGLTHQQHQPTSSSPETTIMSGVLPWQVPREEKRSMDGKGMYHGGAVSPPAQHTISTILLDDVADEEEAAPTNPTRHSNPTTTSATYANHHQDAEDDEDADDTTPSVLDPDFDAYHANTSAMPIPPERDMYLSEVDTQSRMLEGHNVPSNDIAYSDKFYTIVDGAAVSPDGGGDVGRPSSSRGGYDDPLRSTQGLTEEEAMKVRRGAEGWKYSGEFGDDPLGQDNGANNRNTTSNNNNNSTNNGSSSTTSDDSDTKEAPPKNKERSSRILDEGEEEFLADAEGALLEGKAVVVGLAKYEFKQSSAWDASIRTGPDNISFGYSDMPTKKVAHDKWRRRTYKVNQ